MNFGAEPGSKDKVYETAPEMKFQNKCLFFSVKMALQEVSIRCAAEKPRSDASSKPRAPVVSNNHPTFYRYPNDRIRRKHPRLYDFRLERLFERPFYGITDTTSGSAESRPMATSGEIAPCTLDIACV